MNINNVTCYLIIILFIIYFIRFKTTTDCFITHNNNELIKFTHMLSTNIPSLFQKKYDVIVTTDFVSFSILNNIKYNNDDRDFKDVIHYIHHDAINIFKKYLAMNEISSSGKTFHKLNTNSTDINTIIGFNLNNLTSFQIRKIIVNTTTFNYYFPCCKYELNKIQIPLVIFGKQVINENYHIHILYTQLLYKQYIDIIDNTFNLSFPTYSSFDTNNYIHMIDFVVEINTKSFIHKLYHGMISNQDLTINLQKGDRIYVYNQLDDVYNGVYFVETINENYTFINNYIKHNAIIKNNKLVYQLSCEIGDLILDSNNSIYLITSKHNDILYLNLRNNDILDNDVKQKYICTHDDDNTYTTLYHNKVSCNSEYDHIGYKKKRKTNWNQICTYNSDCPYYKANINYYNHRGKCINNKCELPLSDSNKLLCHNCKPHDTNCCENQKDRTQYPNLKSPDYAFYSDMLFRYNTISQKYKL